MTKISKYVKLDKNILLEYTYDDGNLISEDFDIMVDSRDRRQAYIAGSSSVTGNTITNQLFKIDAVSGKYGMVDANYYSFLQVRNYASGIPLKHDTLKFHVPINWTFGEYLGFYIKVYAFDVNNSATYDISNFYFDMTDVDQQYLLNFTSPPLLFQEKLWGKNITIEIPAVSDISAQKTGTAVKENSLNSYLTNGVGLSTTSPIFVDFHFITNIQTINGVTTYLLAPEITTTIPQTAEFERLGLVIANSVNGDFFEIYGTYNNTIAGFSQFIEDAYLGGHRYYVQYNITMYEQNIRGKTITVTQHENFNETTEYRPIIKYSTTTAIIDVEMRLIDEVDDSYIIRRASYGMLQDEVSKYSLRLMKINLSNAYKPKIYNIKNNIDASLIGSSNALGMNTTGTSAMIGSSTNVTVEAVKVPYPVLIDRFNVIGKSENALFNNTTFYGLGKIQIVLYPFDNVVKFVLANGSPTKPDYLNMTGYGEIKIVFKNDATLIDFPLYLESGGVELSIGQIAFKVSQNKFADIKRIYELGVNVFYITSTIQGMTSVVYTGLFKIYDSRDNVSQLNNQAASSIPIINRDPNLSQETAIVTRRPLSKETAPTPRPDAPLYTTQPFTATEVNNKPSNNTSTQ